MRLRFHIVHLLLSNPRNMLKNHQLVNQTDTEFDWFTFSEWLSGPTALCLLIPAQGATGPSRPEVNLSLGEQATVAVATPKIKMFPAVCVAMADGGVSMPPEMTEVPPLQAAEGHLYLKKGGNFYLQQLSHSGGHQLDWGHWFVTHI